MEITLYRTIGVYLNSTLELNPKDYLDYSTEEGLRIAIENNFRNVMDDDLNSDFYLREDVDVIDSSLDIPDEFISEWRKLKSDKNK